MRPRKNILLIDANPDALPITRFLLRNYGYGVLSAEIAVDALELLKQGPDLIVCEFGSMSIGELKDAAPQIPILLTSRCLSSLRQTRAEAFLLKGYTPEQLLHQVKVFASRKPGPKPAVVHVTKGEPHDHRAASGSNQR